MLADERACQRGDDEARSLGARLCVVGVSEPENVARELDDRVLEAASGADERHAPLARVADGRQRALHAPVRARGRDEEAVVLLPRPRRLADSIGGAPLERDAEVLQRRVGEAVGDIAGIEVADDSDHGSSTMMATPSSTRQRAAGPMTAVDSRSSTMAGPSNTVPAASA